MISRNTFIDDDSRLHVLETSKYGLMPETLKTILTEAFPSKFEQLLQIY